MKGTLAKDWKLMMDLWLVDCRNRRGMGMGPAEEGIDWISVVKNATVNLGSRKDGNQVSMGEIISISTNLNQLLSEFLRASFGDRLHSAVSAGKVFAEEKGIAVV